MNMILLPAAASRFGKNWPSTPPRHAGRAAAEEEIEVVNAGAGFSTFCTERRIPTGINLTTRPASLNI